MPTMRLTEAAIEKMKPPTSGRLELWDAVLPGFGVRIGTGRKAFFVMYRTADPVTGKRVQRRHQLGAFPAKRLADARQSAREVLEAVDRGEDPAAAKPPPAPPDTFERIAAEFLKRHVAAKSIRTAEEYRRGIEKILLPRWRGRLIGSITRRDVIEILDEVADERGPGAAVHVFALLRKLGNWCVDRDVLTVSPVAGMKPPAKLQARRRVLSDDELRRLWPVLGGLGYPFGPWAQILLLTGQRRDEAAGMQWPHVDLEAGLWRIPDTKPGREHLVPLPRAAVEILSALPRFAGPFVFSTTGGERPVSGYSRVKQRIDRRLSEDAGEGEAEPPAPWAFHDLRRTVRTNLSRLKVPPHVAELVLNHAPVRGIQAVYDHWQYLDEKRAALEVWARHLEGLTGATPENVVPLRSVTGGANV